MIPDIKFKWKLIAALINFAQVKMTTSAVLMINKHDSLNKANDPVTNSIMLETSSGINAIND